MEQPTLALVRGWPGSGKSHLVSTHLQGFQKAETDDYYYNSKGEYKYTKSKAKSAHQKCRVEVKKALQAGRHCAVANPMTELRGVAEYLHIAHDLGANIVIIECDGDYQNIHGIHERTVSRYKRDFESASGPLRFTVPVISGRGFFNNIFDVEDVLHNIARPIPRELSLYSKRICRTPYRNIIKQSHGSPAFGVSRQLNLPQVSAFFEISAMEASVEDVPCVIAFEDFNFGEHKTTILDGVYRKDGEAVQEYAWLREDKSLRGFLGSVRTEDSADICHLSQIVEIILENGAGDGSRMLKVMAEKNRSDMTGEFPAPGVVKGFAIDMHPPFRLDSVGTAV